MEKQLALLASIVDSSQDAIVTKTLEGIITSWNKAAEKIFGYKAEEIIGEHITKIIPPHLHYEEDEIIRRLKNKERIEHYVTERVRKDGSKVYISLTISPLIDADGNIMGASKIARDITSEKLNEERLSTSLQEIADYKFALDASAIVAITDHKGVIKHVNDNFCKISKYSPDELIGQDHRIVNSGFHSKDFIKNLWGTIAKGKIWKGELKNKAKDGSFYWVDTTIVPFLNKEGKPYQYLAIRADITPRKEAEEALRQLNMQLEERVDQRTEQLAAVNKELESFSYSVSHDLRAPLRAVHGYGQILLEDYGKQLEPEANRLIKNVMKNAKKMGQLIDDLLAFSRLGRKELITKKIDMGEMVANIQQELTADESNRDIQFLVGTLHTALSDAVTIKQVWINLISNAIKYTRRNPKTIIEIGSEQTGNEIIYHIKDNGVGFDMQYANKLFGVFQRLHSDRDFEGTGVGLAIVHRIITRQGGKVWAESKVNEGATFYFSLPK